MVDQLPAVVKALKAHCETLSARGISVHSEGAVDFLKGPPEAFDVVFLDPPFHRGWLAGAAQRLERGGWLRPRALIYLEGERGWRPEGLPASWQLRQEGLAGDVAFRLYRRLAEGPSS